MLQPNTRNERWFENNQALWFRPELGKKLQIIILPNIYLIGVAYKSLDICKCPRVKSGVSAQILSLEALERL